MGGFVQPGTQQGLKPTPVASPRPSTPFLEWFPGFLRAELKPYPGRLNLVVRYTLAATLTMILITTFQIPGAASGGFFVLLVPRDSVRSSLRGGFASILAYFVGLAFVLGGALLFVDYPLTHFLWVTASFFIAFFSISALSNYGVATAFAISIVLSAPVWDGTAPQAALVIANLWTGASVALAIAVAISVEYAFSLFSTKDELIEGLTQRLHAVERMLAEAGRQPGDPPARHAARDEIAKLATVGVSRMRSLALSNAIDPAKAPNLSTTVALVGRLVDLLAPFHGFHSFTPEQHDRLRVLADQTAALRARIKHTSAAAAVTPLEVATDGPVLLIGLEHTLDLLRLSLTPECGIDRAGNAGILDLSMPASPRLLKRDAFTNPEHLQFALRGCVASVLCYFLFNATFWPGLSTSLFTCVVTALSSIGTSRQKQLLRFSGATCGGLILGLGSQVLILPMLDTVAGFTILFATVTFVAAWFLTSSPRLSYFGTQLALAFYLIQLRGPFPQTNLGIARDNVMGILLGLVVMWLVFETLGSKPAVQVMRELFAENLKLMSQLARPWRDGRSVDFKHIRTLRDQISQNFSAVNSQADAVLFEVGRDRGQSLAVRERLLAWQPELRSLFLMQVSLLQFRLQVMPTELPAQVLQPAYRFDDELSELLLTIARAFSRKPFGHDVSLVREAYEQLKAAIRASYSHPPPRSRAVLELSLRIVDLAERLLEQIESNRL